MSRQVIRAALAAFCMLSTVGLSSLTASAERPAKPLEFASINRLFAATERSLHVKLSWVRVSTRGPFALAYLAGGQDTATVLRGAGTRWSPVATISDEGLRCGLVPPAVVADLHAERYNEGPKPCSRQ